MTTRVSPPFSSNVTVVTAPPSPPSSFVHTRRDFGITSMYRPKNAMSISSAGAGDGTAVRLSAAGAVPHDVAHEVVHVVLQISDDVFDDVSDRDYAHDLACVQ